MFKKVINSFISFCNTVKSIFQKAWNWKKNSTVIWGLKTLIVIGIGVLMYLFINYIFPYLLIAGLMLLLNWLSKEPIPTQENPAPAPVSVVTDAETARNLTFDVLSEHANILDVEEPSDINDITPSRYFVLNTIKGLEYYRFIARRKPDADINFDDVKNSLDIFFTQVLQAGFENVSTSFYKDLPYFSVFRVANDRHHKYYICIDIMPIIDDNCYTFIKNFKLKEQKPNKTTNSSKPEDKDFSDGNND